MTPGRTPIRRLGLVLLVLLTAWLPEARAHDLEFTFTVVVIRPDGSYQVDVTADLDALALGVGQGGNSARLAARLAGLAPAELDARLAALRRILTERLALRLDGHPADLVPVFPERGTLMDAEVPSYLGLTARFAGQIPVGTGTLTFQASRGFPPVYLTILDQVNDRDAQQVLGRGEESAPYALGATGARETGRWTVAGQYLRLGFWHIVPQGLDHILFVLGLFLLSTRLTPLLWQVTAFTAAHTASLGLSSYGVVSLSSAIVEPLIALSIAYVAVENLVTDRMTRWRPAVVFLFGLLHGLGFAGVLGAVGMPEGRFLPALLSFNLGVELGQLSVLASAFALIGWARHRAWYRPRVTRPCSALIATVGMFWSVQRVLFP